MSLFMLICRKICFAAIYAVLAQNLFCCDLRTFVWRKIYSEIVLVEKKDKYQVCLGASSSSLQSQIHKPLKVSFWQFFCRENSFPTVCSTGSWSLQTNLIASTFPTFFSWRDARDSRAEKQGSSRLPRKTLSTSCSADPKVPSTFSRSRKPRWVTE